MKYKYKLAYSDYEIGENERLFSDMAKKGWMLCKMGSRFCKFKRSEPQELKYRIELINSEIFSSDRDMPPEQISIYEDCGWQLAASYGLTYVFVSQKDADAPEFYTSPEQQAATLRGLRREYVMALFMTAVAAAAMVFFMNSGSMTRAWLALPEWPIGLSVCVTWGLFTLAYGAYRTIKLYNGLKKGIPIDHDAKGHPIASYIRRITFSTALLIFMIPVCVSYLGRSEQPLPQHSDGTYILLEDLGVEGTRGESTMRSRSCYIETYRTLLTDVFNMSEYMETPDGDFEWMYINRYRVKNQMLLERAPQMIIKSATFSTYPSEYEERQVEGLDLALYCSNGLEYIGVRGDMAYYIVYSAPWAFGEEEQTGIDPLTALGQKLG